MKEPNVYSFFDECYVYYGDYKKEIERLNNIINKAIEYIRQLEFESEELYDISEIARLELLDILKGSGKE